MTCFHPIVAFVVGTKENGKKELKFVKADEKRLDVYIDGSGVQHPEYEKVMLPCGKCIGCKMDRSKEWSVRLMLERMYHEKACFITLTYNDENVPIVDMQREGIDRGYNKIVTVNSNMTLKKEDLQLFMKRLRKRFEPEKLRFFACGEYGTLNNRPHYHLILFGEDFEFDRQIHALTDDGYVQYRSSTLEKIWDYGYSIICECNMNTCAYVARYCVKKLHSHNMDYQTFGMVPEFNTMSRRPGIGYDWFKEHYEEVYPDGYIYMSNNKGGQKCLPPRYFDKLLEEEDESLHKYVKDMRHDLGEKRREVITNGGEIDYFEQLLSQERQFVKRVSSLKREKV